MTIDTIPELLREAAVRFGPRLALRQPEGKDVNTWTWREYCEAAREIAAGLHALGLRKGDHVALCSETRAEFYLARASYWAIILGLVCTTVWLLAAVIVRSLAMLKAFQVIR